jgi:hypothetical protein
MARDSNVESLLEAGFSVLGSRQGGRKLQVADLLAEPGDLNDSVMLSLVEQASAVAPPPVAANGRQASRSSLRR